MKIIIRKKRLGTLSSLLFLPLLQTTANAQDLTSDQTSNLYQFEVTESEGDDKSAKNLTLSPKTSISATAFNHLLVKTDVTAKFNAYHSELEQIEEHYQDHIDEVLDEYENAIANARQQGEEKSIEAARFDTEKKLTRLKQKRDERRLALQMRYHIT